MPQFGEEIPDDVRFRDERSLWRSAIADDSSLRRKALELQVAADNRRFGYQWEWLGTPIIRWPDDIVLLQEMIYDLRPSAVIETGVARGGSLLLSASLMEICGVQPRVLGVDIKIFPHAQDAISRSRYSRAIELWEGDSASAAAVETVTRFVELSDQGPALLVLDSNHTEAHVFKELEGLAMCMPVGSLILVADTIVELMPVNHYPRRPWGRGDNPMTAVDRFLRSTDRFVFAQEYCKRGILSECPNGVLRRVA
jgi:cephalosporin hydroxylase